MNLKGVDRCPHCAVATPLLNFRNIFFNEDYSSDTIHGWVAYQCSTCFGLVGASGTFPQAARQNFPVISQNQIVTVDKIIPEPDAVPDRLPTRVKRYLEQAKASFSSPDGAVMLAGSAVDAMLKAKGYADGSLHTRITEATKNHLITEDMAQWAQLVRLDSNKPRHADLDEPHASRQHAKRSVEFAMTLAHILFVLPAMIAEGLAAPKIEE